MKDIIVDLKNATDEEKQVVKDLLIKNYTCLVNKMIEHGDYATVTEYWVDYVPVYMKIVKASVYIKKLKQEIKKKNTGMSGGRYK